MSRTPIKQSWLILMILMGISCSSGHSSNHQFQYLTDEVDQFAIARLNQIQPLSIRDNVEYCGLIGIDADGQLVASPVQVGERDSCEIIDSYNNDFEPIASFHTHGAYSVKADTKVPSIDDLIGDVEAGLDGYIATPAGRVWVNRLEGETAYLLCKSGCVYVDPNFKDCLAFLPAERYTLETLERRSENDTGEC